MNNQQLSLTNKKIVNLDELYQIILHKASGNDEKSYSKKLIDSKANFVAQKIGEEGVEVVISTLDHDRLKSNETRQEVINEVADLFYHTTAMLVKYDIKPDEIYAEFYKRNNKYE